MTSNEYQFKAARYANQDLSLEMRLLVVAIGLSSEAGEAGQIVEKHFGRGHTIELPALLDELGDCAWKLAEFCTVLGVTLEDIQARNLAKLAKIYPAGYFDSTLSIARQERKRNAL